MIDYVAEEALAVFRPWLFEKQMRILRTLIRAQELNASRLRAEARMARRQQPRRRQTAASRAAALKKQIRTLAESIDAEIPELQGRGRARRRRSQPQGEP